MNKPRKYLLFDRGIIDGHICQNAVLRLAKAEKDAGFNSSYFTLGASARWKFLYGGLNYSAGAQKYVQLKLGVTL